MPWPNDVWTQYFWAGGDTGAAPTLILEWRFLSGAKTLASRFQDAASMGERVRWTAYDGNATSIVEGTWWWSRNAGAGRTASHARVVWPTSPTSSFSMDDGCWAAGEYVDGDSPSGSSIGWGHCNLASSDVCVSAAPGATELCCKVSWR